MNQRQALRKNALYDMTVEDVDAAGFGIGRIGGMAVFVAGALPGDCLRVRILKCKTRYAYGKIDKIHQPAPWRLSAVPCHVAGQCGGCQWLHCEYGAQLQFKKRIVTEALLRIGRIANPPVADIIGMENPYHYRNKSQYPIGPGGVAGFYAPRSHRIIPSEHCLIQHRSHEPVLKAVQKYMQKYPVAHYQEEKHEGLFRHMVIRSTKAGALMAVPVINGLKLPQEAALAQSLTEAGATTIVINTQTARGNTVMSHHCRVISGDGYIHEQIGDIIYRLSAGSFFQVNPVQTQKLYDTAMAFAGFTGKETVIDAHAGVGSVALYAARSVARVYGVEIVPEAVNDAVYNASHNGIENVRFIRGAAEEVIPALLKDGGGFESRAVQADAIFLDPPRKGCGPALLEALIAAKVRTVIYISCEPATLARDIQCLCEGGYRLENVKPVDMFPMTGKVEVVAALSAQ